jgi:hypothetical protein
LAGGNYTHSISFKGFFVWWRTRFVSSFQYQFIAFLFIQDGGHKDIN